MSEDFLEKLQKDRAGNSSPAMVLERVLDLAHECYIQGVITGMELSIEICKQEK